MNIALELAVISVITFRLIFPNASLVKLSTIWRNFFSKCLTSYIATAYIDEPMNYIYNIYIVHRLVYIGRRQPAVQFPAAEMPRNSIPIDPLFNGLWCRCRHNFGRVLQIFFYCTNKYCSASVCHTLHSVWNR